MWTVPTSLIHPKKILFGEKVIQIIETLFVPRLKTEIFSPLFKLKRRINVPISDDVANNVPFLFIARQAIFDS